MATYFFLFLVFATLSAADGVLTYGILRRGGFESNPLMAFAYAKAGAYGIAAVKVITGALVGYWLIDGTLPIWGMQMCIAVYGLVVLHLLRERGKQLNRTAHT